MCLKPYLVKQRLKEYQERINRVQHMSILPFYEHFDRTYQQQQQNTSACTICFEVLAETDIVTQLVCKVCTVHITNCTILILAFNEVIN